MTTTTAKEQLAKKLRAISNKERFELELEFVQSLANPYFIHDMAKRGLLQNEQFIAYLKYLQYWRLDARYAKYVLYPHCFHFLKLLMREEFRRAMRNPRKCDFVHKQQLDHWLKSLERRMRSSGNDDDDTVIT
jgi:mediator of RNA polymerase II transcription subunit 31